MQPPPPPPPPVNHMSDMENGGYNPKPPNSNGIVFTLNILHVFTQICLGGVIVSALIIVNIFTLSETLSKHIVLCITGYVILMPQAILSFSPVGFASNLKHQSKKVIHVTMHILGCILAISGAAIAIAETEVHFDSSHSICGFIAFVLTVKSLVGGILKLLFQTRLNNNFVKIYHSCVGSVTMIVAFIALLLAFHLYYRILADDGNANLAIVLTTFALFGTILMAIVNNVRRILGP